MPDFEPSLRPIEPAPVTPPRDRRRRGNELPFDLERELGGERGKPEDEPARPQPDAPVAPRAEDEAGGHLDVTA